MANVFRLKSTTMFSRTDDDENVPPLRIVFLSVEGNRTERQYFEYIEKYRRKLGINSSVHVHPLRRAKRDNKSAPQDVLELLEEYLIVRETDALPERLKKIIPKEYSEEFINDYLNNKPDLPKEKVEEFEVALEEAGYDIAYNTILREFKSDDDVFGIVIDRDYKSHPVSQMKEMVKECKNKGYNIYITTPLFEFWLLLHLTEINSFSEEELQRIKINDVVSDKHTYTSKLVSEYAGHAKSISEKVFEEYYLPNIDHAIKQAKKLCGNIYDLIGSDRTDETKMGDIGTNIPELFDLLREI